MVSGNETILRYFIEEAQEHLDTIEQGLLDLNSTMQDSESLNELFRAAHSVKGGGAMLGFTSIQKTAHRLEDSFKIIKENPIQVDKKLESLFFKGFYTLRDLLEQLQGPFGLREEEADRVVKESDPVFAELQAHLNTLVGGELATTEAEAPPATGDRDLESGTPTSDFAARVTAVLRQMLQLFRQPENPANRQQLEDLCGTLLNLGNEDQTWQDLVQTSQTAIANPSYSYVQLAPLTIKELKQAGELVKVGRANEIAPSADLQRIADDCPIKRIAIALEPKTAAETLVKAFNQQQLSQLVKALQTATKAS